MRHSPQRVADIACSLLGIARHELWEPSTRGKGGFSRPPGIHRKRKLVVCAVRDISYASFPEIGRVMGVRNHTSVFAAYHSDMAAPDDVEEFVFMVSVAVDRSVQQRPQPTPLGRDTRCDGVWFSPACREEQ